MASRRLVRVGHQASLQNPVQIRVHSYVYEYVLACRGPMVQSYPEIGLEPTIPTAELPILGKMAAKAE